MQRAVARIQFDQQLLLLQHLTFGGQHLQIAAHAAAVARGRHVVGFLRQPQRFLLLR
ncbi:hypothetical protein D3C71_2094940 [compost metagenome]